MHSLSTGSSSHHNNMSSSHNIQHNPTTSASRLSPSQWHTLDGNPSSLSPSLTEKSGSLEFKLFIGNLPSDVAESDLRTVFNTYGVVTDVHVMTGRSQSGAACAFVHYAEEWSAEQAIAALNKTYKIRLDAVDPITVSYAKAEGRLSGGSGMGGGANMGGVVNMGNCVPGMGGVGATNFQAALMGGMGGGGIGSSPLGSPFPGAEFMNPNFWMPPGPVSGFTPNGVPFSPGFESTLFN